eukprot:TRINITY_DN21264_c0_g1_i1.p3 TRINITY_DN21264_c0_g1~~TRINITY_DN21264_c0_g1_i1.p3  ORF type:complete len:139 (+),score=1.61 TRINITY_DN21264_c0_g1_i1:178-594(+)
MPLPVAASVCASLLGFSFVTPYFIVRGARPVNYWAPGAEEELEEIPLASLPAADRSALDLPQFIYRDPFLRRPGVVLDTDAHVRSLEQSSLPPRTQPTAALSARTSHRSRPILLLVRPPKSSEGRKQESPVDVELLDP